MKKAISLFFIMMTILILCIKMVIAQKQGTARIDSLLTELPKAKSDTNKVNLLNDLSYTFSRLNPMQGIKYGNQALELSNKLNWEKGAASAQCNIGSNCLIISDFSKALKCFQTSLLLSKELNDKSKIARCIYLIGLVHDYQSEFDKALKYYDVALNIYMELGDKKGIATVLMEFGLTYMEKSDFPKSLQYYFVSLKMNEEIDNKDGIVGCLSNIANLYYYQANFPKALEYNFKALKLFKEMNNNMGMASRYNDIGLIYMDMGQNQLSIKYWDEALKINEEAGNKSWQSRNLGNIGRAYMNMHHYVKALEYYLKAQKILDQIQDMQCQGNNYQSVAATYYSLATDSNKTALNELFAGNKTAALKQAVIYADSSVGVSKKTGMRPELFSAHYLLSKIHTELGDYKNAFENFKDYIALRDSVYNSDNNKKIAALEAKRVEELNQKQLEIKDLQISKAKNQKWYFISGIFLLICFLIVLYNRYRFKSKANKIITKEKKRSDDLLLNILPAEVAEELKEKGHADARLFDEVTVLFTDFKGFTNYAEKMTPHELVKDIDECFKAFDQITGKYGIEKIKTIGDSYMCAGGLPVEKTTNPEDTVKAALEIRDFVLTGKQKKITEGKPFFEIRIGVHTGPVVAGIVGIKKFAYDIWGDTVNIASRMESSGEAGKVNISGSTYELVKDKFTCTYRGKVEAKNKGMIDMYFVE